MIVRLPPALAIEVVKTKEPPALTSTAISRTLLQKEYPVTVWNRTAEKMTTLLAEGAKSAETMEQAISNSKVIIICVLNYEAVNELLLPVKSLFSGKIIVDLTNGTPMQAEETAQYISPSGAHYLDGGVMAIPPMIGQQHALILYSGSKQAWESGRDLLQALGTGQYLSENYGVAALYDLALLTAMYSIFSGFFQAVAMVSSANICAADFTPMVLQWLAAMMQSIPRMAEEIDTKEYKSQVVSALDMQS